MPDDLNLLLALDVLLRERHITRAARRLGITQSAASQRLGKLREYFGDRLLAPGRPLLELTPRAQALSAPLASALATLRSALGNGAAFDPGTSERRFAMLGNDLVEAVALPLLLPALAREAPRVGLDVERLDADFTSRLQAGTADVALVPAAFAPPSLRSFRLPDAKFVTLAREGLSKRPRRLSLERYLELGHILIAPRGMPGSLVDDALAALGQRRRVVLRVQHFAAVPFILRASDLVVTCPDTLVELGEPLGIVALEPPVELGLDRASVVWHDRMQDDPGHQWLRSLLQRTLKRR